MNRAASLALVATAGLFLVLWPDSGRGAHTLTGWMITTGPAFLAAGVVLIAAWGAGAWVRARICPHLLRDDRVAGTLVALALGLVALQTTAVVLGSLGLFGPWVARAVVAVGLAAAVFAPADPGPWPRAAWALPVTVTGAIALLPSLLRAGAPGTGPDELQYHLRFVRHLVRHGGFASNIDDPLSGFAQGLHALLGLAHGTGGEGALRPFSLLLGVAGLIAGQRLAARVGGTGAGLAYVPIVLGAASLIRFLPVVGSDVPLMLFVVAGCFVVLEQQTEQIPSDGRAALTLGLLGGAAFSIKYTAAVFFGPIWLIAALLAARRGMRPVLVVAASALIPLAFAAPWLLKNVAMGAHPLLPIAQPVVPAEVEAAFRFNLLENYGAGAGLGALLRTPWDLFILGSEFDRRHFLGRLSPWPALALPAILLALRSGPARLVIGLGALGLAAWSGPLRRVVYLLPLWPVLAAGTAIALAHALDAAPRWRRVAAPVLAVALVLTGGAELARPWVDGLEATAVASGRQAPEDWIAENVESAAVWRWVEAEVPAGEVVTTVFMWRMLDSGHTNRWACAEECTLVRLELMRAGSGAGAADKLRSMESRWLIVRETAFVRASYPGLSDAAFDQGFALPLRVLDELTTNHARLRFSSGRYSVYELVDEKSSKAP